MPSPLVTKVWEITGGKVIARKDLVSRVGKRKGITPVKNTRVFYVKRFYIGA